MKPTMTLQEVACAMRNAGIHCSAAGVAEAIEKGIYPFGRVKKVSDRTGYRSFEIFTVDFQRWLDEKTGGKEQ